MALPIGYDNFSSIIEKKLDFIDKTLFIKELLDNEKTQVAVIIRPRRFGKTLNLSMLHHFLAPEVYGTKTAGFFDDFKISKAGDAYMQHQGKYPVVSITFKSLQDKSFTAAYNAFCYLISDLYREHRYLLDSDKLYEEEKETYREILRGNIANKAISKNSLQQLCRYLYQHHGVKPWLLIDEYDSPIQAAYINGYYDEMIAFMRGMLGEALKNNAYLNRAVITGILRIAKESLFSGVNNLVVYSLLSNQYSEYFGFTESEIIKAFKKANLQTHLSQIRDWYNGYTFGETTVYNPWSIVNCIDNQGELKPYWINTSSNDLVKDLLIKSSMNFKDTFELLLTDGALECVMDENMVFADLHKNESAVWSLLLMTEYLKVVAKYYEPQLTCKLKIPNKEVGYLYRKIFESWLADGKDPNWYNQFMNFLLNGELEKFEENFKSLLEETISSHDLSNNPENFYHGFFIGLTATLYGNNNYEVKSNKESGYGRYDYFIFSKNPQKYSLLFEFKRLAEKKSKQLNQALEKSAQEALMQMDLQNYLSEAKQRGANRILKIALAFSGKHFKMLYEK